MFNTKDTYTLSTEQDAMEVKTQIQAHLKIFYQIDSKVNLFVAGAVAFGAVGLGQDSS